MPPSSRIPPRIALRIDVPARRNAPACALHVAELLRRNRAGASFITPPQLLARITDVAAAGFEIGLAVDDTRPWWARWQRTDTTRTQATREASIAAFSNALGEAPRLHAATHWQQSSHGLRLTQRLGFAYASDCRGRHPFVPVWQGEIIRCPQFPTTLPTLDELTERGPPDFTAIHAQLLALTAKPAPYGHVFSLRLPPKPERYDEFLEQLFAGWREQGYELCSIQTLASAWDMDKLPRNEITFGTVPGRRGNLLMQGDEFLSEWRQAA